MEAACSYNDKVVMHPFAYRAHAHVHGKILKNISLYVHLDLEVSIHLDQLLRETLHKVFGWHAFHF